MVKLPKVDLNKYSFKGVNISWVQFTEDSCLPRDYNFLLDIFDKDATHVTFPKGDYSLYDFTGVKIMYSSFTLDSKLPLNPDFFKCLNRNSIEGGSNA